MTRVLLYRGLVWGVVVISIFTLLSLFFVLFQAERGPQHIAGRVVSVHEHMIVISDARGRITTLAPQYEQALPPIEQGVFVQAFGVRTAPDAFVFERIRVMDTPRPKPSP